LAQVSVTASLVEHAHEAPAFALRLEADGKVLASTGDTEWTDNLIAAGRDADVVIAEALVFERRVEFHLDYASLNANLTRIGARRVNGGAGIGAAAHAANG
jgi:ribonuclease BN (tRNA processing enzyme)